MVNKLAGGRELLHNSKSMALIGLLTSHLTLENLHIAQTLQQRVLKINHNMVRAIVFTNRMTV
jgi:hypothetical protein